MKKLYVLIFILFLASCAKKEIRQEPQIKIVEIIKEVEVSNELEKEDKLIPELIPKEKHPLFYTWESVDLNKHYILTFESENLLISAPRFDSEARLNLQYDSDKFIGILVFNNEFEEISNEKIRESIDKFFVYEMLDSISLQQGENYINNDKVRFVFNYKIDGDRLFLNPNSPKQIIFFKKKI